jgi:hypothetical protein
LSQGAAAASGQSASGSTKVVPGGAIDIASLPKAGNSAADRDSGVRLVSGEEELKDEADTKTAADDRYGRGAHYEWLRGKLEYSQVDRQWKLRYIPIDGATDDYGGSVVLSDQRALSGYKADDFVELRGRISPQAKSGYAPEYAVESIHRIGG